MSSSLGRERSKPLIKPLKGGGTDTMNFIFEDINAKNAIFETMEVIGGIEGLQLFNVEIYDSLIENTTIGVETPNVGFFTTLQTGNASGTGYDVCFFGNQVGEYACWDATRGSWDISGTLSVTQSSTFGNIGVNQNTISSVNTNGDINIDPNGFGTIRIEGPVSQHASTGDFIVDIDNGVIDLTSKSSIMLESEQGSGTFSANDGLNFTSENGDIVLRTEIARTQNITSISNTGGFLRIVTSLNHNLNVGDSIVLSNTNSVPLVNGGYTVGNILSDTSFVISGNVTTVGTTGNLVKGLSNSIVLDSLLYVKIPNDTRLTFGATCNSISGDTGALTIKTCGDLKLDVPSLKNIYVMNADTKFHFTTSGTNFFVYDSLESEFVWQTNEIVKRATTEFSDVANVYFKDPILTLGGRIPLTSDDNKDRGIEFYYHTGIESKLGWFGRRDSTGRFTYIPDATNVNEVISGVSGDVEYNNMYVNNIFISDTQGVINVGCGELLNVRNVYGCSGTLTLRGTSNVSLVASNAIHLTSNGIIQVPRNIPIDFGTSGSRILESTASHLILSGAKNIELRTTSNGVVSIPVNSVLTFTGGVNVNQSIYSNTSGQLKILADDNIYLTTTGGNIEIPANTEFWLGSSGDEYIVGNTAGVSLYSGGLVNVYGDEDINLRSVSGDILLNVNSNLKNVRIPVNRRLIFNTSGTSNSVYSGTNGSLYVKGGTEIFLEDTSSINLYASNYVKIHDSVKLTLNDLLSSYLVSNNDVLDIVNNNTGGEIRLISKDLYVLNTGGSLNINNNFTNVSGDSWNMLVPDVLLEDIDVFEVVGHTGGSLVLLDTTNVRMRDPIVTLGFRGYTQNDNKDRGVEYKYYSSGEKLGWFGWKNATNRFTFYSDAINVDEVISGTLGEIELSNVFVNETIQFVSVGEIDLNCGSLLNVSLIEGCSGNLSIRATNNTTISTGVLSLLANVSVNILNNVPLKFGSLTNIIGDTSGVLTLNADSKVVINGDLEILGTSTTIESTVTVLRDPIITLGGTEPLLLDDNKDRGVAFYYHTGVEGRLGFFGFDDTDWRFKYFVQATNANEVITGVYGDVEINDLYSRNISLNVLGGVVSGIKTLSGGEIDIQSTSGDINLLANQSVLIPYDTVFGIGNTTVGFYGDTSGNVIWNANELMIRTTDSITLDSSTSVVIPDLIPLYIGDSSIKSTLNNIEILNTGGNILLTPSTLVNASQGHIVIPADNPVVFCNYTNRIESDCNQLYLYGFEGITLTSDVTTIQGDLNVIGSISASAQTIDISEYILELGTRQVLTISSITNGVNTGDVDITTSAPHNLVVGDTIEVVNTDSVPSVDGIYTVDTVLDSDTVRVVAMVLSVNGTTGALKSVLVSNPGKDVGIQVNYHTGVTQGTAEARFGFFGFKRDTQRWTFYDRGVNNNDVFSGTLGNVQFNKAFVGFMSGFVLEGVLQGGAQLIAGSNFDISGGEIDNTPIGATIASTGRFTTLSSTIQANVEDITINSNLNYSLERFTVSSSLPSRNPLTSVILSFINVSGVSFTSTGNSMSDGIVDGQLKKLLIETMGSGCEYRLSFSAGKLIAPNPVNILSDPTLIRFKRQGQSLELIWSANLEAWIVSTNGAYIT